MYIFKHRRTLQKKRLHKAQASVFVAIGVIIFIALIIGYFVNKNLKTSKIEEEAKKISDLSLQAEEIRKFVNDCIRKSAWEGLLQLGRTGGYIEVPQLIDFKGTGYWYLEQVNIQPFLNRTQERLIEYININSPKCVESGNITKFGFLIEKKEPATFIEFGDNDVTVKIIYPFKLAKDKFTKEFSEFFNTFDIRYRSIFEAATELNERLFDADFDIDEPLKKTGHIRNISFGITYMVQEVNTMKFTLIDKKSITPSNELYTFSFAARFGNSSLVKITDLQNNSAVNPTFLSFIIYSTDKKAQLDMNKGTTISLNGSNVKQITVQQFYPNEVVTKNVPVYKKNSEVMQRQDIKYIIDNPIYTFEPSGILFNKFQKLTLYYDDETKDDKGAGILMGKKGFWVPILSFHEPEYKRVYANILGFTEFTVLYCSSQQLKKTIAEHFFEPTATCYVSLAIMVISILAVFTIFLAGLAALSATATAAGASITAVAGGGGIVGVVSASWSFGLATVGGVLGVAASTVSIAMTALSILSIAMTIVGSTTDVFYGESPDNCETFYPTCAQTVTVEKEEKDGEGICFPEGSAQVIAGQPTLVCAQVKKCNTVQKYLCMPCSVKCTASFY